jgi:uncharacterized membrane protein
MNLVARCACASLGAVLGLVLAMAGRHQTGQVQYLVKDWLLIGLVLTLAIAGFLLGPYLGRGIKESFQQAKR